MTHRIRPRGIKRLFRFADRSRDDIRADVDEEFAFHLDMRVDDLIKEGLSQADARAQARREFGDQTRGAQVCAREGSSVERQRAVARIASELRQDAVFGLRLLGRSPGFSTVAILTLALAIGGNTAIFSLVNAIALKPLPVAAPRDVVRVYTGESQTSWLNYQDIAQRTTVFSDVAVQTGMSVALTTDNSAARLRGETTSTNYLTMLGVPALLGRTYFPSDTRTDLVVLSEHAWRLRFGSDPSLVGRTIRLGGKQFEVIGIMPRGFRGAQPPGFVSEFWLPIDTSLSRRVREDRGRTEYTVVARLKAGVPYAQAQAAVQVVTGQIAAEHPGLGPRFAQTEVFRVDGIGGFRGMTKTLLPLFAFVGVMTILAGLVLLVGCANIAGLLLGRGAARRREIGVRLALGAGRGRLIRQLLTESLLLALAGGSRRHRPRALAGGIDQRPARATARLFRARPRARSANARLHACRIAHHLGAVRPRAGKTRHTHERAAGVERGRSAARSPASPALAGRRPGRPVVRTPPLGWPLRTEPVECPPHRSRIRAGRRSARKPSARRRGDRSGASVALLRDLQSRIGAIPGVESQGLAKIIPLALLGREEMKMRTETDSRDRPGRWVLVNRVTTEWFRTVRIPLLAGRDFTADDRPGSPRVVVVNETLAKEFWNGDALGKRLDDAEVVGVVGDSKYWTLGETIRPQVYTAYAQRPETEVELYVRTSDVAGTAKALRTEIARLDPTKFVDVRADDRRRQRGTRASASGGDLDRRLRNARCAARNDGNLRPRRVQRRPAHARDRHPQSDRRHNTRHRPARRLRQRDSRGARSCGRHLVSARSAPSASAASSSGSRPSTR